MKLTGTNFWQSIAKKCITDRNISDIMQTICTFVVWAISVFSSRPTQKFGIHSQFWIHKHNCHTNSFKNTKLLAIVHFAILALLSLSIHFKNSLGQMTFRWMLWKTYYTLLLKKCLRALSRAVHVLIRKDKLNYLKFPSWDLKNSSWLG